jgi:hypothetical protein
MTPAQSTFRAQRKGLAHSRAGLPNLTECRLREIPIGPDAARKQPAPLSHPPRPHNKIARRQAWPLARCQHDSESMASMAAAQRQVGRGNNSMFGIKRRAQSPARAASRICSEVKTSMITQIPGRASFQGCASVHVTCKPKALSAPNARAPAVQTRATRLRTSHQASTARASVVLQLVVLQQFVTTRVPG